MPIRERVEAASRAGFVGFSVRHGDLLAVEDTIGFGEFGHMLTDNGLKYLELECCQVFKS